MSRSKKPPHQGALGKLNTHWTPRPDKYRWTSSWLKIDSMILVATLKVFLLSETILEGKPLCAVNLFKHQKNVGVERSAIKSKCMAQVTQQVNRHIHTFLVVLPTPFRWSSLAKSTPVCAKGGDSSTLNVGNGGGKGAW